MTSQIKYATHYSLVIGLGGALIRKTLLEMTAKGVRTFVSAFESQPIPVNWNPLVTPRLSTQKDRKLMMGSEDIKHFIQLAPFALRDILMPSRGAIGVTFTDEGTTKYSQRGQPALLMIAFSSSWRRRAQAFHTLFFTPYLRSFSFCRGFLNN